MGVGGSELRFAEIRELAQVVLEAHAGNSSRDTYDEVKLAEAVLLLADVVEASDAHDINEMLGRVVRLDLDAFAAVTKLARIESRLRADVIECCDGDAVFCEGFGCSSITAIADQIRAVRRELASEASAGVSPLPDPNSDVGGESVG